jgi:four helix bundle protein
MNDEGPMTNDEGVMKSKDRNAYAEDSFWNGNEGIVREAPETKRVYDLKERTAPFGEALIDFARMIPQDAVTNRIVSQLAGAATSVGANYVEADDAVFKKGFLKSIGTCRKEARETKHFLQMIVRAVPELKPQARTLWLEAKELHLIFSRIWRNKYKTNTMRVSKPPRSLRVRHSSFVILSAFDIRISSFAPFVIRHFPHAT